MQGSGSTSSGFTLVEVMIGLALTGLVMAAALSLFVESARQFQDGTEYISFVDEARVAEQRVSNVIQYARATSVTPGNDASLDIVQPDLTSSRLYFQEGNSLASNRLVFDPDVTVSGDEEVLARYVSEIEDTPIFRVVSGTNNTTLVSFYIGLRPPEDESGFSLRKSYTGAIIHMTASPRNIVDYIQQ